MTFLECRPCLHSDIGEGGAPIQELQKGHLSERAKKPEVVILAQPQEVTVMIPFVGLRELEHVQDAHHRTFRTCPIMGDGPNDVHRCR